MMTAEHPYSCLSEDLSNIEMDLQVIVIADSKDGASKVEQEKVILYDPNEGRASKRQLCMYLMWITLSLIGPLWMASIVERPYTMVVPSPAQLALTLQPSSSCESLDDCGPFATSFNVSLEANLAYPPSTAYPPVIFASVAYPNPQWWVAGVARNPLSRLYQEWDITGGCYGAPGGKLYLVACLPSEGQVFVQGQQVSGPPFDDRCTALGTWCGGSCSNVLNPPHCDSFSHQITAMQGGTRGESILANDYTIPAGSYTLSKRSFGTMTTIFVFFSALSMVTFLLNHCAPVAAWLERIGRRDSDVIRSQYPALEQVQYLPKELSIAVVSIFCYEKSFHIVRNIIGVAVSWQMLDKVVKQLGFKKFKMVHYVVDNSNSKSDCMASLLSRFVTFFNENSDIDWSSIQNGLREAPFEPTRAEYDKMLPPALRNFIDDFLDELGEDRIFFDPFFVKDAYVKDVHPQNTPVPPLIIGKIQVVDMEVVRLQNGHRSKVLALQECANRFHVFRNNGVGFMALMDARHMMTPTFWQYTLPAFFIPGTKLGVIPKNNEETGVRGKDEYFENTKLRLVQVMQYFPVVNTMDDYFDRGNSFNYLYSNAQRHQVQSVTSCGTNALWAMRDFPSKKKFNFQGKTLIEDTETSHAFLHENETSIYIPKGLVCGSVKDPEDYGEAPSRWAAGAIQLLFVQPAALTVAFFSLFFFICIPLTVAIIVGYLRHGEWVLFGLWFFGLVCLCIGVIPGNRKRTVAKYVICMVNTTYWLTGPLTAMFWMNFIPIYILITGRLPFEFNAQAMMVGGLLVNSLQWVLTTLIKKWAKAEEMHLWRSQQAWYALWPLNFLGIPRLLNPHTSWQISTIQAKVTFVINASELLALVCSMLYALVNISERIGSMAGAAAQLIGFFAGLYSLLLLFPTTSYLFNSLVLGKKHTYNLSSRHLLGGFLVICLVLYAIYVPDWSMAFSQFFSLAKPVWLGKPM